ncbi:hypothetical protein [Thermaerobacillus caldiproteolyticus]|nr:hypothetical protein [Anoxybacillus caldiproteolyticus]
MTTDKTNHRETGRNLNETREEFAFEFGDFNAHQMIQLIEETKRKKKKK